MPITRPRSWLALAAVLGLVGASGVWAFTGSVPSKVSARGLLVKSGGLLEVVAPSGGPLAELAVDAGDTVAKGQLLARIDQPELARQIEKTRAKLAGLEEQVARLDALGEGDVKARAGSIVRERGAVDAAIRADEERALALRARVEKQSALLEKGLVTQSSVEATRAELAAAEGKIARARADLAGLSANAQELASARERDALRLRADVADVTRELELMSERFERTSRLASPTSGRVLELRASLGEVLGTGRPILTLEPTDTSTRGLVALLWVPLSQGKLLRPGMTVQLAAAGVPAEEHGLLLGKVTSVSELPSTEEGMKRALHNELLVRDLLEDVGFAPIAVEAELVRDPSTPSGHRWTSGTGSPLPVGPGTPTTAEITVKTTRPILLVVPGLKRVLGV
ncbi:NHLP bacteriocin system secretion protein [Myxococcota bacterium]|nr:NHLP bacteriocin system secretion protein [Myxococcota bacterium]